jgi:hypothetical protein
MSWAGAAEEFRGRRVVIKAGLGLLGSYLARELVAAGRAEVVTAACSSRRGGERERLLRCSRGVFRNADYVCLGQRRLANSEHPAADVPSLPLHPKLQNTEVAAVIDALDESAR